MPTMHETGGDICYIINSENVFVGKLCKREKF